MEQFPPLRDGMRRPSGDRIGVDSAKTQSRCSHTHSRTAALKPGPGLNGPPDLGYLNGPPASPLISDSPFLR